MTINNVGFGNMFKEKMVDILFINTSNEIIRRVNLGKYKGQSELKLNGQFLPTQYDTYRVLLKIYGLRENNRDYYYVQFANDNLFDISFGATYLFRVVNGGEIQK